MSFFDITADEAAQFLTKAGELATGIAALTPGVPGLVVGGVGAAFDLVGNIIGAGANPIEHITRIKRADAFLSQAEADWRKRYNELIGVTGI